ncbi:F-box only protein 50 [Gracilinanus agilis]|uniref:F-box only protein 50 n=1 Tax=Gracilinanus agilis TaxID=191870 RepID=UPI001CFDAEC4|nr:F-box only protein 50 [Gracilinanus agilis]
MVCLRESAEGEDAWVLRAPDRKAAGRGGWKDPLWDFKGPVPRNGEWLLLKYRNGVASPSGTPQLWKIPREMDGPAEGGSEGQKVVPRPQSPPFPPRAPTPPPPLSPGSVIGESPLPVSSELGARQLLLDEWGTPGAELKLPEGLSWKLLYVRRPLYRNLLRSPNPEGINIYEPPPPCGPPRPLETLGNFSGWQISTEKLLPSFSWTVKQQCIDLLAEGLWEELLDKQQPDITVMDWFENSCLDTYVYELHVWLLAADRRTIIRQYHNAPRPSPKGPTGHWCQVSHVFKCYGPGVRFIHFLHKAKNRMGSDGFRRTRVTDSSVSLQLRN